MIEFRPVSEEDSEPLWSWLNDPETVLNGFTDPVIPQSIQRVRNRIRHWMETPGRQDFMVRNDDKLVGLCQVYSVDFRNLSCEVGVVIGQPDFRRRGIGKAAMLFAIGIAFDQMNMHRCQASVLTGNVAGMALVRSVGMTLEGTVKEACFKNGQYHDISLFGLLRGQRQ